jgi:manganese/iron transport system permease protein
MHLHLAVGDFSNFGSALLVAASMAVACAVLSVFVVARRWAFIGEGISHSGFGGAGTAWLLALAFPAAFDRPWVPYAGVVVFSLGTAVAIGYLTRRNRVDSDTAIGIFLVASLAWGSWPSGSTSCGPTASRSGGTRSCSAGWTTCRGSSPSARRWCASR